MGDRSKIEWTDATWNPIVGCSIVSPGCTNCYAMPMARRLERMQAATLPAGTVSHYAGLTKVVNGHPVWTGKVTLAPGRILTTPLRWKKPRRIFVNSMSDLFHESVPDEWIDRVFAVMALCPQHTFQVLTKRAERMRRYIAGPFTGDGVCARIAAESRKLVSEFELPDSEKPVFKDVPIGRRMAGGYPEFGYRRMMYPAGWPLPNVWLGVSAEDQKRADERIPLLLGTPAAVRFLSAEPLLGPIDFETAWHGEDALDSECWGDCNWCKVGHAPLHNCRQGKGDWQKGRSGLDWVIVGGESGPNARPMHPVWARSIRDQCAAAGVPFLFKQNGEWLAWSQFMAAGIKDLYEKTRFETSEWEDNHWRPSGKPSWFEISDGYIDGEQCVGRVGKKAAGRLLDGVEHNGYPDAGGGGGDGR